MTTSKFHTKRGPLYASLSISLLVHLTALVAALPQIQEAMKAPPQEPEQAFEVATISEEELAIIEEQDRKAELERVEKEPEPEEKPLEELPKPVKPPSPPNPDPENRKAVVQETNEERPTEANFLSDQDNKVDKETRAKETTDAEVDPGREKELAMARTQVEEQLPTPEMHKGEPPPQPEPEDHSAHDHAHEEQPTPEAQNPDSPMVQRPKIDPKKLFQPNMADYDRVFGSRDQTARARIEAQEGAKRPKLMRGWEDRDKALKASIENFITEIQPGNHTGVNAHRSTYAGYIAKIHRKIHPRWANGYLMYLDTRGQRGSELNDPRLTTKLELIIRANDGVLENINIVSSSGQTMFDAEAISIINSIGRHPNPPPEIVSPNGRVYIHWQFWRDQRQCGTFGASVLLLNVDEG